MLFQVTSTLTRQIQSRKLLVLKFVLVPQAQSGSYDPFFMKASKRGQGTRQEPNVVNSLDSFRCIGCICNEGDTHINWMWLYEGKPKRCECGYWFELKYHPAPEEHKLPL